MSIHVAAQEIRRFAESMCNIERSAWVQREVRLVVVALSSPCRRPVGG
jgi:hypothetical protein